MIKHVHGEITNTNTPKHPNIVLSAEQYYKAYQSKQTWTYQAQFNVLSHNTCLFIGSSMSDLYQMSIIRDVQRIEESGKGKYPHRLWKCFALLCIKDMKPKDKISVINYYK